MDGPDGDLASLIDHGRRLAAAGQWDMESVTVNVRILQLRPGSLAACNRLATCCLYLGYLDQAEKLCLHVLQLDPHNLTAQRGLDAVAIRRKHEQLAEGTTGFYDAFQQGLKARRRGNNHLAVVLLEKACRLASNDACRISLAASYRATGRLADAEAIYRSVLEKGFNEAAAVGLAGVRRDQGRFGRAAELDEEVLQRLPGDNHARSSLEAVAADKRKPPWERKAYLSGGVGLSQLDRKRAVPHKAPNPVQAYFDGLCHPHNPGGYACGGWYIAPYHGASALAAGLEGHAFYRHGAGATNNMAEYNAALDALRALYRNGYTGPVVLHGDSQLVINQFNGMWKCHKPELQELLDRLRHAATFFQGLEMVWVPREQNARADEESRQAYREAILGGVSQRKG
jgi:ribonuclease HI/Flp pilus assembly protein TadD